jgi:plasmid stabilization system protein ParE
VTHRLHVEVSHLAKAQVLAAEQWWRVNRSKAPNAIREELERASFLIANQPEIGARALDVDLPGVRRLHLARVRYDLYYRVAPNPDRVEILAFWHASRDGRPPL